VQSYDYDGQQMTQFSPQLYSELAGGKRKMGSGDYLVAGNQNPIDACQGQDVCCKTPNLRYSMRVDCVASDAPLPADGYWPAVTTSTGGGEVTGCRYVFDGDRDGKRAPGNIIKPDFSFDHVPAKGFTQHVINTVDFPFADMDNRIVDGSPAHIQNDGISWQKGQAIVQNVFSMFACDAGTANEPPFFLSKGFARILATSTRVKTRQTSSQSPITNAPFGKCATLISTRATLCCPGRRESRRGRRHLLQTPTPLPPPRKIR